MQHYHLHFTPGCGIIMMSRGERNKPLLGLSPSEVKLDTPHKKHERTSRKPLDNGLPPCYNNDVKRGYTPGADTETNCAKVRTETIRLES